MSELLKVFELTANQAGALSKQAVTDTPLVIGGVTVVPVNKLSCGFAGGGSDLLGKKTDGIAAGAGVKVSKTPVCFLAFHDSEVEILTAPSEAVKSNGLLETLTPWWKSCSVKRHQRKNKKSALPWQRRCIKDLSPFAS